MKLAIFGGTGRTGISLIRQALGAGHSVTALARSPEKLTAHEHLSIVPSDLMDAAAVDQTIASTDAVISVLGPTSNTPDYLVSKGMSHILASMQTHRVRRLIVSVGAGVRDPNDTPGGIHLVMGVLVKLLSRHVYEDMRRVDALGRASDTDWTIVRVPMLTDDPLTGKITAAYVGKGSGMRIGRADLARFMLAQVEDLKYLHQAPAIGTR